MNLRATLAIEWNEKEKLLEAVLPSVRDSMDKKRDVQEVMLEEGRRGRRRVDLEAQKARREKLAEFRKLLETGILKTLRLWKDHS